MLSIKKILSSFFIIIFSFLIGILICESVLRVKHKFIINYDIEMWKYAKKLKIKVDNEKINHVHVKNKSAILQNIEIKINKFGQRDVDYDKVLLNKYERSFLILGSSVAMGWGVEKEKIFSSKLNEKSLENKKVGLKLLV